MNNFACHCALYAACLEGLVLTGSAKSFARKRGYSIKVPAARAHLYDATTRLTMMALTEIAPGNLKSV
jgi:hypothetical protein